VPELAHMTIAGSGKYLGFVVGPEKGNSSWYKALHTADERVSLWSWGPLGLYYATQVWNTYILSTMGFAAQPKAPCARHGGRTVGKAGLPSSSVPQRFGWPIGTPPSSTARGNGPRGTTKRRLIR
jgi:hypothetical protein